MSIIIWSFVLLAKKFNIKRDGSSYYQNNAISSKTATHSLKQWHEILRHHNIKDILKLLDIVDGMEITEESNINSETCTHKVQYYSTNGLIR